MDSLIEEVLVEIVVNVLMTKAASRTSSTHVPPVVVVVCDVEVPVVEVSELCVVTDK